MEYYFFSYFLGFREVGSNFVRYVSFMEVLFVMRVFGENVGLFGWYGVYGIVFGLFRFLGMGYYLFFLILVFII